MKTTFQLWLRGLFIIFILSVIVFTISYYTLPNPISLLEAWGLIMLFVITKTGIDLYNKSEPLTNQKEND